MGVTGVEPAILAEPDPKSGVFAISPQAHVGHFFRRLIEVVTVTVFLIVTLPLLRVTLFLRVYVAMLPEVYCCQRKSWCVLLRRKNLVGLVGNLVRLVSSHKPASVCDKAFNSVH